MKRRCRWSGCRRDVAHLPSALTPWCGPHFDALIHAAFASPSGGLEIRGPVVSRPPEAVAAA
jgi:hypothetical protein